MIFLLFIAFLFPAKASAQTAPLRRPLSPSTPMWLVHVDSWVADPQQCIDLIPADIRPYVVMNLALSLSITKDGYNFADAWLNTCAQNGMWAMVQPSSGINNVMSDTDIGEYEDLYRKYPNLIGFNFCEQSWGYNNTTFTQRLDLFAKLLALGNKYGGYLYVNDCFSISNASFNSVAKLKTSQNFAAASKTNKENFIVGDKFTNSWGYYDNESGILGTFLSGHAGHYAIRYDQYSWGWSGRGQVFGSEVQGARNDFVLATFTCPEAVMGIPIVEHMMLTGATVIDGPEVAWMAAMYKSDTLPAFSNMICDVFRKVLDGTIRIPTVDEVAAHTKIAFINDVDVNTPDGFYAGLYEMDGSLKNNRTWFKKTGRYPGIPEIYSAGAYETSMFTTTVKKSQYASHWPTQQAKVDEFNTLFPSEYSGNMFTGRMKNSLFSYNPWINTDTTSIATIPLKYNTCDSIALSYPTHTFSIINESGDQLQVYLNNYRTDKDALWAEYPNDVSWWRLQNIIYPSFISGPNDHDLRNSIIVIYGSTMEPSYTFSDRGNHDASEVSHTWSNGVFALTVKHNGPVDITIDCSGSATGRLPVLPGNAIAMADAPPVYKGDYQYEAEYAILSSPVSISSDNAGYIAHGYAGNFSSSSSSAIKFIVQARSTDTYNMKIRYSASQGDVTQLDLFVNGTKIGTPTFTATANDDTWAINNQYVSLDSGINVIEFKANASGGYINIDNIVIESNDKVTGVKDDLTTPNAIKISPNPASDKILISWEEGFDELEIHNAAGGSLLNKTFLFPVYNTELKTGLEPGVYIVTTRNRRSVQAARLIVLK